MGQLVRDDPMSVSRTNEAARQQIRPVVQKERSVAIDVLRGFAMLGILTSNINDFGVIEATHDIPVAALPAFAGHHHTLDLALVAFQWLFFEGKMRGLFSLLFGAGVIMLTSRAEAHGAGASVADIYTRRNLWLLMFGLLHGTFLWDGDILFEYALVALIALYPCRKLKPKNLLYAGTIVSMLSTYSLLNYKGVITEWSMDAQITAIHAGRHPGQALTSEQTTVLQAWEDLVKSHEFTSDSIQKETDAHVNERYWRGLVERVQSYIGAIAGPLHFAAFMDTLGLMLIGMGLYKVGFLTGERSYATYTWTALSGFLVSIPIYLVGLWKAYQSGFDFVVMDTWLFAPYYVAREAGTLAIVSVIVMIIKARRLRALQRGLANVGKTALTSYLTTTVVCVFIFKWGPWPLYAKLEYYQLLYVLLAIWSANVALSSLWLRFFQFGPMEWIWRSLTYVHLQPMRRQARDH